VSDFDDMDEGESLTDASENDCYSEYRPKGPYVPLTVPINLGDLAGQIVNGAALQLCKQVRKEVIDLTHAAANEAIANAVESWAERIVKEEVARPRKKTNSYGRETGEVLTLDELAASAAVDYMKAEVNARGDRASYNEGKISRLQFLVNQAMGATVEKIVKEEVGKAVAELRLTLATAAQKEMGEAVLRLLGIKG
jgi:hypothetical protein